MSGALHFSEAEYKRMMAHDGDGPTAITEWGGTVDQTPTAKQYDKLQRETKRMQLRLEFEQVWRALNGPPLEEEVRFHQSRRWRFDYCHLPTRTAIELEGGIYTQGSHVRPKRFQSDIEKYDAAAQMGYTVKRLTTGQMTPEHVQPIIDHIKQQEQGE